MGIMVRMVCSATAADLTLKLSDKQPPAEVSEPIKKVLQAKAIQLLNGDKPVFEFWWRKDVPIKAKPESAAKSLETLDEITLLGVAVVGEGQRDYKDNEIAPGTYTMRFGLQPQDGDHLGTSEFPFFAVLIPTKTDTDVASIKTYKAMVKGSGKGTATGHPIVLSLRPSSDANGSTPTLTSPAANHKAVRLTVPGKAPGSDKPVNLVFELVYEGKYKS